MASADRPVGIMSLSDEIITLIFQALDAEPRSPRLDQREFMSVVSFRAEREVPESKTAISNLRRAGSRFEMLGLPILFKRVIVRFSWNSFETLQHISRAPHIAGVVQELIYIIPRFFFTDRASLAHFKRGANIEMLREVDLISSKELNHIDIVESHTDIQALGVAFESFGSLQHVSLKRVEGESDRRFARYLSNHIATIGPHVELGWTASYTHGARTLSRAYMSSRSPAVWFSFSQINTQSAMTLRNGPSSGLTLMASRLQCLLLRFDDSFDFGANLHEMSRLFQTILIAAPDLRAFHVGFATSRPVSVKLVDIFGHIRLEKLKVLSLEGWRLDESEIQELVCRHKLTLNGLRLRGVLLKRGSMWKNVLRMVRQNLLQLKWLSLSEADYDDNFRGIKAGDVDVTEDSGSELQSYSEMEDDLDDFEMEFPGENSGSSGGSTGELSEDEESQPESLNASVSDLGSSIDFTLRADTPLSDHLYTCPSTHDGDDIGDNGRSVTRAQRRTWELYAVRKCHPHGEDL